MQLKSRTLTAFFIRFIIWSVCFQSVLWLINDTVIIDVIERSLAQVSAFIGQFFIGTISVVENHLIHPETDRFVVVNHQCTGLTLIATLVSAVCALPFRCFTKFFMAIGAIILIQLENIIRIIHLFYEIKEPINHFVFFHLYFWQAVNFISALLISWLIYDLAVKYENNHLLKTTKKMQHKAKHVY